MPTYAGGYSVGGPQPFGSQYGGGTPSLTPGGDEWYKNLPYGDILQTLGAGAGAYAGAQQSAADRRERQREFDAQMAARKAEFERGAGNTEAQQAVQAQTALNKAPLADNAQALLLARMGVSPETFQPRDLTQGVDQFRGGPSGGPGNITDANTAAAAAYTPGSGGVDTSVLEMLKNRMVGSSHLAHPSLAGQGAGPRIQDARARIQAALLAARNRAPVSAQPIAQPRGPTVRPYGG